MDHPRGRKTSYVSTLAVNTLPEFHTYSFCLLYGRLTHTRHPRREFQPQLELW